MKSKAERLETIKMLISSKEYCSQDDILKSLSKEGIVVTQATLSRDMKQLKIAKAASMNGKYVFVLPNETMYRRVLNPPPAHEMLQTPGFLSINFTSNLAIIRTRPGYASAIAYDIDNSNSLGVLGTIAGDDTIFVAIDADVERRTIIRELNNIIPGIANIASI